MRHELEAVIPRGDDVDGVGRCDAIARLDVPRRLRQAVELNELLPCVALGEASAHWSISADRRGSLTGLCFPLRDMPGQAAVSAPRRHSRGDRRLHEGLEWAVIVKVFRMPAADEPCHTTPADGVRALRIG
jgi:hypothetical protein